MMMFWQLISGACSGEIESVNTNDNTYAFEWLHTLLYDASLRSLRFVVT